MLMSPTRKLRHRSGRLSWVPVSRQNNKIAPAIIVECEDACGCFEFLDGFELLRYLKASEFNAVTWEVVPGTECKKAVIREVDESTLAYREFERQLYMRALDTGQC